MQRRLPNYKMMTFQKVINEIGISKDKEILNMQIEDLAKIKNFQKRDLDNIIELRAKVKNDGVIAYLKETNEEYENNNKNKNKQGGQNGK